MNALRIASKDLQIFFKDRGFILQLIVLPIIFAAVFSGALVAISSQDVDQRTVLVVVDADSGDASQELIEKIEAAGGVKTVLYDHERAIQELDKNDIPRFLLIPEDFSENLASHKQVTVVLTNHPEANPAQTEAVRLVVVGAAQDMSLQSQIVASLEQMGVMQANAPQEYQIFSTERIVGQANSQFENAQAQPLVSVNQMVPGKGGETDLEDISTVPGIAVLFVFMTAQACARMLYDEKKVGAFRRLLAAPINNIVLLIGKMLPNIIISLVQLVLIFLFGVYGLKLLGLQPMSLGNSPISLVIVCFIVALCSSSLGILIAALARTENQIGGISSLVLWGMAALGGCIIPLFFLESFLGPISQITPHYWANRAFDDLFIRGLGFGDILLEIGILLVFSALFFGIGLWRLDFSE